MDDTQGLKLKKQVILHCYLTYPMLLCLCETEYLNGEMGTIMETLRQERQSKPWIWK